MSVLLLTARGEDIDRIVSKSSVGTTTFEALQIASCRRHVRCSSPPRIVAPLRRRCFACRIWSWMGLRAELQKPAEKLDLTDVEFGLLEAFMRPDREDPRSRATTIAAWVDKIITYDLGGDLLDDAEEKAHRKRREDIRSSGGREQQIAFKTAGPDDDDWKRYLDSEILTGWKVEKRISREALMDLYGLTCGTAFAFEPYISPPDPKLPVPQGWARESALIHFIKIWDAQGYQPEELAYLIRTWIPGEKLRKKLDQMGVHLADPATTDGNRKARNSPAPKKAPRRSIRSSPSGAHTR